MLACFGKLAALVLDFVEQPHVLDRDDCLIALLPDDGRRHHGSKRARPRLDVYDRLLIASPRPVPPYFRVVDASACENS
jgi:hypothetical protein